MRILAVTQGKWGERIADNVRARAPEGWTLQLFRAPRALPIIVDDPEEFLPESLPQADLVLALVENPSTAQLVPAIAARAHAAAVLCPIDNSAWVPPGLKNQLQRELAEIGIESVFPKPFCTLTEETAGYRRAAERYMSRAVSEFAKHFGHPAVDIEVDEKTRAISRVRVVRGAPCGSTHYGADRLVGTPVSEAVPRAGLLSHQYPCLASMDREQIDDRLFDTLMHVSGFAMNEAVEEKLRPYLGRPQYFTPDVRLETAE